MRIFRRHFNSLELLVFVGAYLLGNYIVFYLQGGGETQTAAHVRSSDSYPRSVKVPSAVAPHGYHGPGPVRAAPPAGAVRPPVNVPQPRDNYAERVETHARYPEAPPINMQRAPTSYPPRDQLAREVDSLDVQPGLPQDDDYSEGLDLPPKVPPGWGGLLAAGGTVEEIQPIDHHELNTKKAVVTTPDAFQRNDLADDVDEETREETDADTKTILFWNSFFESEDFRFGYGQAPFFEWKCPVYNCRTTSDKRMLEQADAVMFHGPRIENFPPWRSQDQIYIYVQQEPHQSISEEELPAFHDKFNLTITHRSISDIYIPYAKIYSRPEKAKHHKKVTLKTKRRDIVWVVSHCHTPAKREWYVKELRKYIDIDIYGGCGTYDCAKDDVWGCFQKFEQDYKFYLSFENNYCKDYVSEKLYRPLEYNIIPVVFGGANYSEAAPPHSVISVDDFPTPKELARYLKTLGQNEKAYNRYFAWKSQGYEIDTGRKPIIGEAFCKLCEVLHDPDYPYRSEQYRDLRHWWVDGMCDPYYLSKVRKKNNW